MYSTLRRSTPALVGALALLLVACGREKTPVTGSPPAVSLASVALTPAELSDDYVMDRDEFTDEDGNHAASPTRDYIRGLTARGDNATPVARRILITLSDRGVRAAQEFIDAADTADVGPPNLQDYIQKVVAGSHDVRAEIVDNFPQWADGTVANLLTWRQNANGLDQSWRAFGVYVRAGGLLAFISVRAPDAAEMQDALRKEAEDIVHKQAEKLRGAPAAAAYPRSLR